VCAASDRRYRFPLREQRRTTTEVAV